MQNTRWRATTAAEREQTGQPLAIIQCHSRRPIHPWLIVPMHKSRSSLACRRAEAPDGRAAAGHPEVRCAPGLLTSGRGALSGGPRPAHLTPTHTYRHTQHTMESSLPLEIGLMNDGHQKMGGICSARHCLSEMQSIHQGHHLPVCPVGSSHWEN